MKQRLGFLFGMMIWGTAWAQPPVSASAQAREQALATVLRCPVCQNQNLADSNADLARDLRREIAQQIALGRTDDEIRAFMVQRYGDFVLYEPPVDARTVALWVAPFAMLGAAAGALVWQTRQRRRRPLAAGEDAA